MCGRYDLHTSVHELLRLLRARLGTEAPPSYNVAPTRAVAAVREAEPGDREVVTLRWGLVPAWSKGPDSRYSMINARAETIASKPAYRSAFRARRCLIPANGFYEWRQSAGGKQPWYITVGDTTEPFLMAGIWERWRDADGVQLESCAIVTTQANSAVREIHERMPVILELPVAEQWLDPSEKDPAVLTAIAQTPLAADRIRAWPVSTRVNSPANDEPACAAPLQTSDI
jgi:putative SOS response-associated peptidase YedK